MDIEAIFRTVLDCAFEVHRTLGPGLLENTYKQCLAYELSDQGLKVEVEKDLPVIYRGTHINCGYRVDLMVEECIIVELKSVERLNNLHLAQVLAYLKLADAKLGLLINFNTKLLKQGIKRVAL